MRNDLNYCTKNNLIINKILIFLKRGGTKM